MNLFSVLLLQSVFALLVQATIFITQPLPGSVCSGGKTCTIEWLDNGVAPLLGSISACHVGLYYGQQQLIQQIDPVDVSAQHSLVFTPDPNAGPNADLYYINFTSINTIDGLTYNQFSAMFTLKSMTGSLNSPVASDTSAIPVPSSLTASSSSTSSTESVSASQASFSTNSISSSSSSASASSTIVSTSSSASSSSGSDSASSTSSTSTSTSTTSSAPPSNSSTTSSGFVTSSAFSGPRTTLTVGASTPFGSALSSSSSIVPAAPTSTDDAPLATQNSAASRTAGAVMPVFLAYSLVLLTFII